MSPATRGVSRSLVALVAVFGLLASACGDDDDTSTDPTDAPATQPTDAPATQPTAAPATEPTASPATEPPNAPMADGPTIRVRGQDFSEAVTIAEVYGQYLAAKGYNVEILTPAGFRTEAIEGITNGDLDLIIDYIGGSLTALAPDAASSGDPEVIVSIIGPEYEKIGATLLDYSPAVDGDAFVVRGDLDATTISDAAGLDLVLGASAACFERPQCFLGYTDPAIYGIEFGDTVTIEFGPLLGEALASGDVDAVIWNSTAPQISKDGFKVLEDDLGLHPAQNIAPIISTSVLEAYGAQLAADLNALSAAITTDDLVAWNVETDVNFRESNEVATEWLMSKGLI